MHQRAKANTCTKEQANSSKSSAIRAISEQSESPYTLVRSLGREKQIPTDDILCANKIRGIMMSSVFTGMTRRFLQSTQNCNDIIIIGTTTSAIVVGGVCRIIEERAEGECSLNRVS